jgi:hypothetical protein
MRDATKAFGGMQPRVEPYLLPAGAAQDALNVVLHTGKIVPLRAPVKVADLAKVGTKRAIFRYGRTLDDDTRWWFHWLNDTDVAIGPIPDDTSERVYYTEAGQPPRVTDATMATGDDLMPAASYLLGIPAPTTRAVVTVTPDPDADPDATQRQECYLAYTFVSAWGEEGPPNEVSEPFEAMSGDTLNVVSMEGPPAGAYNITHKRLYVSVTDATGVAVLRFWKETAAGATSFSDVLEIDILGEALPEFALVPPPEDLFGLMAHPAGFMVGFSGQRVYRSEVFKPYGWPYHSPVPDYIVGGAILGQATVICTGGGTYMATQADPQTFTPVRLEGNQPCVAKRSIKAFQAGVLYASPDGLVLVDPTGGIRVVTESIMTREQWQAYRPESMHAAVHDNRYYCWYDTGAPGARGVLILEVSEGSITLTRSDIYATAAYADPRRDELFVALPEDDDVHKWNAGSALVGVWMGRRIILERPQNIGAVQVVADAYPVQFRMQATVETDSGPREVVVEKTITSGRPTRLRGNYRARDYTYTVSGTAGIREVTVASVLANVTAV